MGARAQYVIVENGTWHRHYSHWGANGIINDLLPGPAAATRCFRAGREIDEWLDDVWCEGAALVDHDRRVLLWCASSIDWDEYAAARAVLARTWPGWDVRFAHDGLGDLTHHLGLDRDVSRSPGWFEAFEPDRFAYSEGTDPRSVVSLRLPDGSVRAWGSLWEPVGHVAGGPALIDLIAASPRTPAPAEMPDGGVHFDPQARTVSLWSARTVAGIHDWPLPRWEGWALDFRGDDHTHQSALLPADFPFPRLSLAPALRRLGGRIATPQPDPAALLAPATAAPGPEGTTAVVNPDALTPHDPVAPTPAELTALRTALDTLIAESETA
ncbi:hypothetical protein [Streptomyces sp. NPDC048242]|uniref:hypothetical protein n=1 Tax=Streptomyces sp. NPDC048242 TaxID=3155026 RepID=UPI00343A1339